MDAPRALISRTNGLSSGIPITMYTPFVTPSSLPETITACTFFWVREREKAARCEVRERWRPCGDFVTASHQVKSEACEAGLESVLVSGAASCDVPFAG